jgi:hypothetical protein
MAEPPPPPLPRQVRLRATALCANYPMREGVHRAEFSVVASPICNLVVRRRARPPPPRHPPHPLSRTAAGVCSPRSLQ